jgi:regulator of protease activity HflC (stomatin/prohibitin superfamily)
MINKILFICLTIFFLSSCSIVQPGEVGVKQRFGKLKGEIVTSGMIVYNPFITKVVKAPSRTTNLKLELSLPSKEGLSVGASISILYFVKAQDFKKLLTKYGVDYEPIVTAVFNSAASDVCAKFFAKDMHSGKRADIEKEILAKMKENLSSSGIEIENVLMKSIQLPAGLANSIEEKLQAEQDAMRMEFVLQQAKLEAERNIIQAKGTRDAQIILSEGLTNQIIQIRSIEAFNELSKSPNAKIIITDGKAPFLIE